jgi:hypothetical protein
VKLHDAVYQIARADPVAGLSRPLCRAGERPEQVERAVDVVGGVIEVRREPEVAVAQRDVDASASELPVDGFV